MAGKKSINSVLCKACNSDDTGIVDVRKSLEYIRRRNCCFSCSHKWTTYQIDDEAYQAFVKAERFYKLAQKAFSETEE